MSVPLAQQAQESLGHSDLVLMTERVDDGALRIGQRVKRGWPEVLERPLPRHWTPRGRRWGWTAVLWLAAIVTAGDHRTVSVATSLQGRPHPLRALTAQGIAPRDGRDDRVSPLLTPLRQPASWHQIEHDLHARSMEGHAWPQDVSRCNATTVSGEPAVPDGGLWPCGQRKEEPTRPQSTVMLGALAPLGMPRSTEGLSGARADDGFSLPTSERMRRG